MGTSSSNGGPRGATPLVPDWYGSGNEPSKKGAKEKDGQTDSGQATNPSDKQKTQLNKSQDWAAAKGALTRKSNNTRGSSIRKAGRSYIHSLGGTRSAVTAARMGVNVGSSYGEFLASASKSGLAAAFTSIGLENLTGKSPEEICVAIVNSIAPNGATNDEAIAREALIETLDSLYSKLLEQAGGLVEPLENLTSEIINETVVEYVGNYIFTKWMYELGIAIEKGNISVVDAVELEKEVKNFIVIETQEKYRDVSVSDNVGKDSQKIITEIFNTAYSLLES